MLILVCCGQPFLANHTDRGWLTNIEAGVFVTEDEMVGSGMDVELDTFFSGLRNLDKTIPLSLEYVEELERLSNLNTDNFKKSKKACQYDVWEGLSFVDKKTSFSKRKDNFKNEWLETLGILQNVQSQMETYRPKWIAKDIPAAWQVDQFLHAYYYYNHLGDRLRKPFEDEHRLNKANPQGALTSELEWWQSLAAALSNEDRTLYEYAPEVRLLLSKEKILELTEGEFESVCLKTHATMDHVIKIPTAVLGRPDLASIGQKERMSLFAPLSLKERNKKGWSVLQLLEYVLYGGSDAVIWERLYHAGRDPEYGIARYGLNSIAEVVGWARPEVVPPRNGRTSKALRALGFDVKIY